MSVSLMVDLEALDNKATAAILTIALVAFEPDGPALKPLEELSEANEKFYVRINLASCLAAGLTVNPETISWWFQQEEAQRLEAASAITSGIDLRAALLSMSKWIRNLSVNRIWSHGISFDCAILEHAASKVGISLPWKYTQERNTRTLFDVTGTRYSSKGLGDKRQAHNALTDAYYQSLSVQRAWAKLKGKGESEG
jgi:hypothetical protein